MFYFGADKADWVLIDQSSVTSVLGAQTIFDQYGNFAWHLNGLRFRNLIVHFKNQTLQTFVPSSDLAFITRTLKPRFMALDEDLISGIKTITSSQPKMLDSFIKHFNKIALSSLEDEQLASLFLDYYQVTLNDIFLVNFKPLELSSVAALTGLVASKVQDKAQIVVDVAALATMDKASTSTQEEIDLCQIVHMTIDPAKIRRALTRTKNAERLLERNYPDLNELLHEHFEKYRFLVGSYSGLTWELGDVIRRYVDFLELGPEWVAERIEMLADHSRQSNLRKRRTLSRLKDDGTIRKMSKIACDLITLDERNRIAYAKSLRIREAFYDEIVERIHLHSNDLRFYTLEETLHLIREREPLDKKEIARRMRGVIFNSGIFLQTGSDAARFLDRNIPILPRRHILHGKCAWPGQYEGEVRIVRNLDDVAKVAFGDIVVTSSCGTEYLEAVRKAGAVVSEGSGMLSPLAQMCREVNTPCIIEADGALITLNDGDRVLLDAETQTVCFAETNGEKEENLDICSIRVFDFDEDEPVVVRLEEVEESMENIFGQKAVHLGMMIREGYQVPPGFAIGRSSMYQYLAEKGCEMVDGVFDAETVEKARKILTESVDTDFVRSMPLDATVIFDEDGCVVRGSWLPVEGVEDFKAPSTTTLAIRTLEGLWKAIRKCWLTFLEHSMTAPTEEESEVVNAGGGVVIQQYKPGDRSGIIKSLDLEHPGSNVITLEACLGAGHSLYSGKSRPDRYRISRKTERIINRIIPLKTRFEMVQPKTGKLILIPVPEDIVEAEVLTRQQIKILVNAVLRIEKLMENPVELEWTIKGGEIYILKISFLK